MFIWAIKLVRKCVGQVVGRYWYGYRRLGRIRFSGLTKFLGNSSVNFLCKITKLSLTSCIEPSFECSINNFGRVSMSMGTLHRLEMPTGCTWVYITQTQNGHINLYQTYCVVLTQYLAFTCPRIVAKLYLAILV
jgi:hypothetical protein